MKFIETPIEGAWIIEPEPFCDERGSFSRVYCSREFYDIGIKQKFVQTNFSQNNYAGTLRGLHFQDARSPESKLVKCSRGALWDVVVDLRSRSSTYLHHYGLELSAQNGLALLVPEFCAHGFMTLEDNTDAIYMTSGFYNPDAENGCRFDDPALDIKWPAKPTVISEKDKSWPML